MSLKQLQKQIVPILKKSQVKKAAIFGSFARGEANKKSDIDILIQFQGKKDLFDLIELKLKIEDQLKRKIHILTYNSLHPLLKDRILKEQILIF